MALIDYMQAKATTSNASGPHRYVFTLDWTPVAGRRLVVGCRTYGTANIVSCYDNSTGTPTYTTDVADGSSDGALFSRVLGSSIPTTVTIEFDAFAGFIDVFVCELSDTAASSYIGDTENAYPNSNEGFGTTHTWNWTSAAIGDQLVVNLSTGGGGSVFTGGGGTFVQDGCFGYKPAASVGSQTINGTTDIAANNQVFFAVYAVAVSQNLSPGILFII